MKRVLFVCQHGSAKSVIAAAEFNRLAGPRGLEWRAESAGVEPDIAVPDPVVDGLASDGIDVRGYTPRGVTGEVLGGASHIVSFECDLGPAHVRGPVEQWRGMPMVSDGFLPARDAIVARVERLLDTLS